MTIGIVILVDLFFLGPLSFLLAVHTLNFANNKTTGERFGRNQNIVFELDARSYAEEALLNYSDRNKLFINKQAEQEFYNEYSSVASGGQEISSCSSTRDEK